MKNMLLALAAALLIAIVGFSFSNVRRQSEYRGFKNGCLASMNFILNPDGEADQQSLDRFCTSLATEQVGK